MIAEADPCPISRTVRLVGGRWTQLILRELFFDRRRFDQIQRSLGVSRATLADRLQRLVSDELVERIRYEAHPPRFEYRLTDKGRALWPVLAAMWAYGAEWLFEEPTPGKLVDPDTDHEIVPVVVDAATGAEVDPRRTRLVARSER